MRFPPSFIERVRDHFRVSEVVGKHVPLKRKGREYTACCPFHSEKTPSFYVNDEKAFYHCFGCGAHGDAIRFVMEFERLSYPEAIRRMAEEAGIALPVISPALEAQMQKETTLLDAMEAAARFYALQLDRPAGGLAREYLQKRGVSAAAVQEFRLGCAPDARDGLKRALLAEGFTETLLVEAGLLIQPEQGASYDRFRGRLMFPILNASAQTIAFGARLLAQADGPKYLNSPETPLFKKGEQLFHYHTARRAAASEGALYVAEGYMDVIALADAGIRAAVAPLGTALTEAQLALLWRMAPEPVLCLDGDAAGERAMARAAELALPLLKPGQSLSFMFLPPGEDPDSLIRTRGRDAFKTLAAHPLPLGEVLLRMSGAGRPESGPEQRAAAEARLYALLERIPDQNLLRHYRQWMRERLANAYYAPAGKHVKQGAASLTRGKPVSKQMLAPQTKPSALNLASHNPQAAVEALLLCTLTLHPWLIDEPGVEDILVQLDHLAAPHRALRDAILDALHQHGSSRSVTELTADALSSPGLEPVLAKLHAEISPRLPRELADTAANPALVRAAWAGMMENKHLAGLENDYREAEALLAAECTESTLARVMALKEEIEGIRLRKFDFS